ncbi:hypothetical protein [Paraburkholderia bryophila]|uniref:Uncharacterized protein n=1 Tax=Paraburkholderia bryophila TaxID=420952 RepID=A0A7Y9W5G5_9BURK|nr:hypothetical protein [Paraburkholderia bryophila]NYH14115.1 hypothetical protein [Paraburkholderia bryophila]
MLREAMSSVRDMRRLHDIAAIPVRNGFGDVVRRIGLADALQQAGRILHWRNTRAYAHMPPPERVRRGWRAGEAGGPTLLGLPKFGLLGFCGAVVGGVWLVQSAWKSGRRSDL